jgi:hypothetical protein
VKMKTDAVIIHAIYLGAPIGNMGLAVATRGAWTYIDGAY